MTDDWTGTKLELEAGLPNVYYVTLDSGTTELVAEDWLELAPADAPPPPAPKTNIPTGNEVKLWISDSPTRRHSWAAPAGGSARHRPGTGA